MKLYLAHKIFEDLHKSLTFEEAKEKAFLFIKSIDDVEEVGGDYWIQISKEWDLRIWWEDCTSLEMTLYQCALGEDGFFHDNTQEGFICITNKDFPVDEEKLKSFLEYFENMEYYNTGVHYISGGFTIAEYQGTNDDDEIYIRLTWGIQNDVENRVNKEDYWIPIEAFNNAESNMDIYKLLDN